MDKRPAEERQLFSIGEDVHVQMIGTVKAVEKTTDGLRYVVENIGGPGYERCYIKQSQMCRLEQPEDFQAKEGSDGR